MIRKIFALFVFAVLAFSSEQSKIVYLRLLTPMDREFYVGEKIEVKYSLLLFSGASLMDVEFIPNESTSLAQSVQILNPNSTWTKKADESYENTFVYKIKSPSFALPSLKVVAISSDGKYIDSDEIKSKKFEAISLGSENYASVLAKDLRVSGVRAKKYDEWNNIVVFDLVSNQGNLEDFKLKGISKQDFSGDIKQKGNEQSGSYYCVIPSHLKELKFAYFNLQTLRYEEKILSVVVKDDRVSTQTDLDPKNNFLILSNILLAVFALVLLILAFYFRRKKYLFWLFLTAGILLIVVWLYQVIGTKEVILKPNAKITILPTYNSTPMPSIAIPVRVEVIGEHNGFYKIKFEDSKIGWVKKDECQ